MKKKTKSGVGVHNLGRSEIAAAQPLDPEGLASFLRDFSI